MKMEFNSDFSVSTVLVDENSNSDDDDDDDDDDNDNDVEAAPYCCYFHFILTTQEF